MLIDINEIIVNDRIRRDFGNIEELADNIKKNGLLNPLTVNGDYKLLAGERRLRACKMLGWNQVDVRVVKSDDEAQDLEIELSENNLRRNFTGSELAEGIRRQMAIEAEKAKERSGTRTDLRQTFATGESGRARDKAAEQFGISGEQARKTLFVDDNRDLLDPADFADWDEGRLSTNKAFQRIKAAQQQAEAAKAQAEHERKRAERELQKASITRTNLEMEAESLRQQVASAREEISALERQNDELYAQKNPEPEVITREVEVVREVESEESKRRIRELEHTERLHGKDNQKLRRQLESVRKELDRAKGILNMGDSSRKVQNDVEYLIAATNQYVRNYGGLTWTFEQIGGVDETTREELRKAVKNLATFSSALVAGLEQI